MSRRLCRAGRWRDHRHPRGARADDPYRTAYGAFLQKLRTRYGAGTTIVAVGAGTFADHVQQIVRERAAAGDGGVRYWLLDGTGLDNLGCHWHYSARDHRLIADRLTTFIAGLPLGW